MTRKMQYDILQRLFQMKDSDDDYEKWMTELEVERDK
jgi:hypothetical protein